MYICRLLKQAAAGISCRMLLLFPVSYKTSPPPVQLCAYGIVHNSMSTFCRGYPYSPATRLVAASHLACYTTTRLLLISTANFYSTHFTLCVLLCVRASDCFLRCCLPQTWISTIHTAASVQQVLEFLFCLRLLPCFLWPRALGTCLVLSLMLLTATYCNRFLLDSRLYLLTYCALFFTCLRVALV